MRRADEVTGCICLAAIPWGLLGEAGWDICEASSQGCGLRKDPDEVRFPLARMLR